MGLRSLRMGSSAIALVLSGSVACADVTAEHVWTDFKGYLEGFGYTVNGTEQTASDGLTVSGLTMTMAIPDDGGTASLAMDSMTFTELGDGRVRVTMPDRVPMAITATPPDGQGEDITMTMDYAQKGFDLVVSGDPDNFVYTYSAAEMAFVLNSLSMGDVPMDIRDARMTVTDLAGNSASTGTELRQIVQTMTAGALSYVLDIVNPEDPTGVVDVTGSIENLSFDGTASLPADIDTSDMPAALKAGFAVSGGYTYENGTSEFAITGQGQSFEGNTSSEAGNLTMRLDSTSMLYSGEATGVAMNYAGTDIPLPITLTMGQAGFNMLMPIGQTEDPTDFGLGLTLGDVAVSDMIWGMIDPAGQLPRDPATIQIDLAGKARLTQDIMDEQAMMAASSPFGEIHALTVNALTLAIAGARLSGAGDFTFDNADMTTFPGMPRPQGALDLQLTGGNSLLDTLVAMGLLPEEQAMGARMMLGLFARPGSGPDSLTSRIEITPDGQLLANGQRLR
ncbi:DUF2125 domain-containing protein [Seohaeicola saemankumensis]|uniref:DUF2125 domain-containing protein n=1 Tax=Seohaeicola TaxID=481178 RepID=UPI0035CED059